MASAIITGELTNHIWKLTEFISQHADCPMMKLNESQHLPQSMFAYAGYLRDSAGTLRKAYLGEAKLERGESVTFSSGEACA